MTIDQLITELNIRGVRVYESPSWDEGLLYFPTNHLPPALHAEIDRHRLPLLHLLKSEAIFRK